MISIVHRWIVKLRVWSYRVGLLKSKALPCKVVSIGNLTVGGTGKTPMTVCVAKLLQQQGYEVVVISRGYRGKAEKHGGMVSDGHRIHMDPDMAGDEPYMMSTHLDGMPIFVGQNRYQSGLQAVRQFRPDVIVLDDGYQHLKLQRDLNLLLLDARSPFGNQHMLPRGPLREPETNASRADAIILTRCPPGDPPHQSLESLTDGTTIFRCKHIPTVYQVDAATAGRDASALPSLVSHDPVNIFGRKVCAFSGIAGNDDFKATLEKKGVHVVEFLPFEDHHQYTDADLALIARTVKAAQIDWLATTEKDFYRIIHRFRPPVPMIVVGIEISFEEQTSDFSDFIIKHL